MILIEALMMADRSFPRMLTAAGCGFVATIPMTAAMLLIQRLLPSRSQEPIEPRQITDDVLDRTAGTHAPREEGRQLAALVAHFGYGTATGAAYPLVDQCCEHVPARGALYGVALYALSYAGWLPAADILPMPQHRRTGRNLLLIASHVVWGATLQQLYERAEGCTWPSR